jgi:hypothetical protein
MRKALVVGIDHYDHVSSLHGCVNDAHSVKAILERHGDGSVNFDVMLLAGTGGGSVVSRGDLKDATAELFADDGEIALFYFAGHGHIEMTGGYLCPSEIRRGDEGMPLGELLTLANKSRVRNKVIVLDSCHSGIAGNPAGQNVAELSEGMTILTASTDEQYATEENASGVFTTLFVDALSGAASNLVGEITPGSVYAHIDQSLGPWQQRPVFKTNVKSFVSLRRIPPPIALADLRRIVDFFPDKGFEFPLDPSYEPEMRGRPDGCAPPDPANTGVFSILQSFNRVGLLKPIGAPHMWNAAIESRGCQLTVLGEHYRNLVARGRI